MVDTKMISMVEVTLSTKIQRLIQRCVVEMDFSNHGDGRYEVYWFDNYRLSDGYMHNMGRKNQSNIYMVINVYDFTMDLQMYRIFD